ncbi:PREDICTED: heparanase-like [Ceratosolen solmsi marchali]|uniref:Heparanase-like n=1 Tax=Ceratosolen solmsi marchali TaxID=326594 RepID=A0AAJ6YW92_9HYME|nr:PREDICTED: heparanase-like [Ceratosolen solmsi marchali]
MRLNLLLIGICSVFIITSSWLINHDSLSSVVFLKENQQPLHIVSDKFLSFGLDSSLLRNMKKLPINDHKFINLVRHLSPAYVRIGGTNADCLYFEQVCFYKYINYSHNLVDDADISNFTLTSNDFLSIYKFTEKTAIKMIFDLNVLLREPNGSWNSDNTKEIIVFSKSHEMEIDWQLGNEPNSFLHVFNISISAQQLANDYCKLRTVLNELGYQDSILVGPEANHVDNEYKNGVKYGIDFLNNVNNCVDYFTWHQYYLNGHIAQLEDFLNPKVFNRLSEQISTMGNAIRSNGHNVSMWLSETSSAYGGGAPKLSDRFVAGFLWLDKLGYSAKAGVKVIIRQSLFGGNYAMIDENLDPNPDWWVTLMFKQFVSNKVLSLNTPDNFGNIRLYAHCALKQTFLNGLPAVTIYGINLNDEKKRMYIQGISNKSNIFAYFLTSDNLQSSNIFMNGEILRLLSDGSIPPFKPKIIEVSQGIELPSYSMVFLLIDNVKIPSCLEL